MNVRGKSTPGSTPGSFTSSSGPRSRATPVVEPTTVVVGLPVLVTVTPDGGWVLSPDVSELAAAIRETIDGNGGDGDGDGGVLLEQLAAGDEPDTPAEGPDGDSIVVGLPVAVTRAPDGTWTTDVDTVEMVDAIRESEADNADAMIAAWRARPDH